MVKVIHLIQDKLGPFKQRKDQTIFEVCPFCKNDRWNFEVNLKLGVWHCWVCNNGGLITKLLQFLHIDGVKYEFIVQEQEVGKEQENEVTLPQDVELIDESKSRNDIMKFLYSRGITEQDIVVYNMLYWYKYSRIVFPFYNFLGHLVFWTARRLYKNQTPKYLHAHVSRRDKIILYEGQERDEIFIVEGVFDGIRLNKEGKSVMLLLGSNITDDQIHYLRIRGCRVVMVLDSDMIDKQLEYEERLGRILGGDKVRAVYLKSGDVGSKGLQGEYGFVGWMKSKIER